MEVLHRNNRGNSLSRSQVVLAPGQYGRVLVKCDWLGYRRTDVGIVQCILVPRFTKKK